MHTHNEKYLRQIGLAEIGEHGQELIRQAKVLLVGVGGLGVPIAQYLCGAGVGTIGIVDDDCVSVSNLHRQVLYNESQVGLAKVSCAKTFLQQRNYDTEIISFEKRLTQENAHRIIKDFDIVVDGCDNYETRYIIDRVCAELCIPYVYGSIQGFTGMVSVFHYGSAPISYTDLFPCPPKETPAAHVVGMTAGVVGCVQAHEVLKIICGYGEVLSRRLWTINLLNMESHTLDF